MEPVVEEVSEVVGVLESTPISESAAQDRGSSSDKKKKIQFALPPESSGLNSKLPKEYNNNYSTTTNSSSNRMYTLNLKPKTSFDIWLENQRRKDRFLASERFKQEQRQNLYEMALQERKLKSQVAFEKWKSQKQNDALLIRKLDKNNFEREIKQQRFITGNLPGYISAWSCDVQLGNMMQNKCPRLPKIVD